MTGAEPNAQMSALYRGLIARLSAGRLRATAPGSAALGWFALANGTVSIALIGAAAAVANEPLLFPSLGPTAYLLSTRPLDDTTSPHNIIIGHLIGVAGGYLALTAFGLLAEPSAFIAGASLAAPEPPPCPWGSPQPA